MNLDELVFLEDEKEEPQDLDEIFAREKEEIQRILQSLDQSRLREN